jgi:hypothetical protein
MVTHIVIFSWLAGVTDEQIADLGRAFDSLAAHQSDVLALCHGRDLAFREGNGDYALVATFADQAGWAAYQADPAHKAVVRDYVTPIQASRLTIQF